MSLIVFCDLAFKHCPNTEPILAIVKIVDQVSYSIFI